MNIRETQTTVRAGFIPLVDCAPLAVAREKGFAAAQGVDLQLFKEASWANIRDRVNVGQFDVAHMLAGMPIAANLGVGHVKVPIIAPMALGAGGNAITVGQPLYDELARGDLDLHDPLQVGEALRAAVKRRGTQGQEPLTFAMVFPFSNHNYQLRYWMAAAGINPDVDVRLAVIPPPYMVQSLKAGQIDGFCVGEPWNSLAAEQGVGNILLTGAQVWPAGPEKVLGVRASWADANPGTLAALLRALHQAAHWADEPVNRAELATILAGEEYLDIPLAPIEQALQGDLRFGASEHPSVACEHALWLYTQMVRWGQIAFSHDGARVACDTYRPDLLAAALDAPQPQAPKRFAAPLNGPDFDPTDIAGYIERLRIKYA